MPGQSQPISKVLLDGLYDQDSPLSQLRGCQHIMRMIWNNITLFWEEMIEIPVVPDLTEDQLRYGCVDSDEGFPPCCYLTPVSTDGCSFPPPSDININMMPFIVGETFASCKLPSSVQPYWPMIKACLDPLCLDPRLERAWHHLGSKEDIPSELGKVNYLTIQECWVEQGTSQRRPGLHVDSPGKVKMRGEENEPGDKGRGSSQPYKGHHWGEGCAHSVPIQGADDLSYVLRGGIYISSSLQSSCRAWNCSVGHKAVGRLGDIEHMREALPGPGEELQAGQMYWITDRTPHESLPLSERAYRQFFRLVTSKVSFWYKDHSTPNPLGVEPDPTITLTVVGDKFSKEGVEVVEDPGRMARWLEEVGQQKKMAEQRCCCQNFKCIFC